jgi:drug/metabolite transporter (DMT)-like permease
MTRTILLTFVAMMAFAANSVLCRLALSHTAIDPASFSLVRLSSGAAMLWVLARVVGRRRNLAGSWRGAGALLVYAIAFSMAYVTLPAGTGALLLFGTVQATMIVTGLVRGETLSVRQWVGLALALTGLVVLVAPGIAAPSPAGAAMMVAAGVGWGAYSLLGRNTSDPMAATAGNFIRAAPLAIVPVIALADRLSFDPQGLLYAVLSGTLASGVGYILWYAALPGLSSAQAASVQLSVPVITALGGALLLNEAVTARLAGASLAVLGGISVVILGKRRRL